MRIKFKYIFLILTVALVAWIAVDLYAPHKAELRNFDPVAIGKLETAMWRAYYEKAPARLFWNLGKTLRSQFHAPFWRSQVLAYQAARAALTFQKGTKREEYNAALPYLEKYFGGIRDLSKTQFDAGAVAVKELEWWIIRREPDLHKPEEWTALIAGIAAEIYSVSPEKTASHAELRVQAMLARDSKRLDISEADWSWIEETLVKSWELLYRNVN